VSAAHRDIMQKGLWSIKQDCINYRGYLVSDERLIMQREKNNGDVMRLGSSKYWHPTGETDGKFSLKWSCSGENLNLDLPE
jgi:hypothetical protein